MSSKSVGIKSSERFVLGDAPLPKLHATETHRECRRTRKQPAKEAPSPGNARQQLESKSGRKVITRNNYLIEKPKPKLPPKSES
jgi:hypothetical protein